MMPNDDERYGEVIPPHRTREATRVYDGNRALNRDINIVRPGYGLGNLIATLRHKSATRLMEARTGNVEALTRLLYALDSLGYAMTEREWALRQHENMDARLDARERRLAEQQAHEDHLNQINREREIKEAELARDRITRPQVSPEQKEPPKKPSPIERIRQGVAEREELNAARDEMISEVLESARRSGNEDNPAVKREIENIKADIAKEIARTYEKG